MDFAKELGFLQQRQAQGQATVLVTVIAVTGSSMRNTGTLMGVAEDGSFAGSLSGGCIEQAVVAEALAAIQTDAPRLVRFGEGSPYLDIRLPCGGGLDIRFEPLRDSPLASACLENIAARQPFAIEFHADRVEHGAGWRGNGFDKGAGTGTFSYWPAPKIVIIGHGASVDALDRQARGMGCHTQVLTPDQRIVAGLAAQGRQALLLERTGQTEGLAGDAWSAFAFLFHDHDWEVQLMARALALPHFYIGAMGGRGAHAARCEALVAAGVDEESVASIHAPIGLFHSSRDPETLALSALAEIVRAYQRTDFEAALG